MKNKHIHCFELKKPDFYCLYDQEDLTGKDEPIIMGTEREVKVAISKFPKESTIVSFYELKKIDLTKDGSKFEFKKLRTIYPKTE